MIAVQTTDVNRKKPLLFLTMPGDGNGFVGIGRQNTLHFLLVCV